jgi:putative ABC transport system permease protein
LFGVVLIKFSSDNVPKLLADIKNIWQEYNPNLPFEYHFLDQTIDQQYVFERQLSNIFTLFSLLAIAISISGLLGLAVLLMGQRTKEIGIRKVLGASVFEVIFLLSKEFTKWVLIANVIAWPVAYYFMNKWLQDFAYRIDINWWIFILSGGVALMVALGTVSFLAIKAATANPIDSLRYE